MKKKRAIRKLQSEVETLRQDLIELKYNINMPQLSEKASKAYNNNIGVLLPLSEEIDYWLTQATRDRPFNDDFKKFPLPMPRTLPACKEYIASIYDIEASDVDLILES
jgi:hypothetical protein